MPHGDRSTACPHFLVSCCSQLEKSNRIVFFLLLKLCHFSVALCLALPWSPRFAINTYLFAFRQVLGMFSWDEVETLVCGKPEVDVDLLEVRHEGD